MNNKAISMAAAAVLVHPFGILFLRALIHEWRAEKSASTQLGARAAVAGV